MELNLSIYLNIYIIINYKPETRLTRLGMVVYVYKITLVYIKILN